MRKYIAVILLATLLASILCGCDLWTNGFYISEEPYQILSTEPANEVVTAETYVEMRDAVVDIVEDFGESVIIAIPSMKQAVVEYYMDYVVDYILNNNAMGAYSVKSITYDIGTNVGETAVAVSISYNYSRSTLLRIKRFQTVEDAFPKIEEALAQYDMGVTLYISKYKDVDISQLIEDYVDAHPELCMEMPQITVELYPERGKQRLLDLTFTYRNSREVLRSMQENVQEVFNNLRVSGETDWERYSALYTFLMNRHEYTLGTSITPSYSLLRHGVGDSKAFATVFAAMCQEIGLECYVVSGTRSGEAWCWNIIQENDEYYHLDLLQCSQIGAFRALDAYQLNDYIWDYSAFPTQEQMAQETSTADSPTTP